MFNLDEEIIKIAGASKIVREEHIQTLWSGYGEIKKYYVEGGQFPSVIVKHILWPDQSNHPKGWNTATSHQRKMKSYQVESHWYQQFSQQTNAGCRVPKLYHAQKLDHEILLIMEDLDASGFYIRKTPDAVFISNAKSCLRWLAHFHSQFLRHDASGLWPVGTYWHLATRPDEWRKMKNTSLKNAAQAIDSRLNGAKFKTIVHGDAKLANFCFDKNDKVAAVDFQYVGEGCGMKDVAYLISSCFDEEDCEQYEEELLNEYFKTLKESIGDHAVFQGVKEEWSRLYKYAWADFYRFLDGWSPGHWKMHDYSKKLTQAVIKDLGK